MNFLIVSSVVKSQFVQQLVLCWCVSNKWANFCGSIEANFLIHLLLLLIWSLSKLDKDPKWRNIARISSPRNTLRHVNKLCTKFPNMDTLSDWFASRSAEINCQTFLLIGGVITRDFYILNSEICFLQFVVKWQLVLKWRPQVFFFLCVALSQFCPDGAIRFEIRTV